MILQCMYCLVAMQTGETAGDHKMRFINRSTDAVVVYHGESMCLPHFNVVRGHSKDYGE